MQHFRVAVISANNIGTKLFTNPTKLDIDSLTIFIMLEKFDIIKVTIKMYWT